MVYVGIDQSLTSTAVCIIEDNKDPVYHVIVPKITKKMQSLNHERITYHQYTKTDDITHNINSICNLIEGILLLYVGKEMRISLENVAFAASGRSLIDLSMLNGAIRRSFPSIKAFPPTEIKKFFTGNGQATKDVMVYTWSKLDPIDTKGNKVDDIADSYAMANLLKTISETKS